MLETPNNAADNFRIEYRGVGKQFANKQSTGDYDEFIIAVKEVDLSVRDGEVVSLIGPSGCGKSTLLNMGSGLYQPSAGEVFVDQQKVDKPNSHVGFMLQKDLLLAWRSIRQNVEFGLEIQGVAASERRNRSSELLEKCRLTGFEEHYPHQLSGGMRQRAALARTLATDPHVLLMDEPFSALDAQTKMILQQDLAETLSSEQKTALFITHDLAESVALSDRVFVMSQRPGTIVEEIDIDLPLRENPMARRHDLQKEVGEYVARLMDLLHVGDMASAVEI
ncbi:MAG: ABC transporter ATP-binding protein [Rhodospirillaceae bacterium]|jgi:NitT/TauT family transport system ATP-binding protein|nr:ABC transporter ATP-binding protein [Rhodospirillaceae bacterium]MBT4588799.1 ABC transporter ATP-binding protein [Rhodospirillaceae bacterium]MBT4940017.1 ABC transporter ATP-binding protein [Rhodospirillaceae bacterium]MBT5941332.1 ABC transporter ATP-binding protein [Rhodospirillaceae bacterium]MBT7266369.1 ABC transporter ATP-binding protein [Rhodospirillaceae bacterium]